MRAGYEVAEDSAEAARREDCRSLQSGPTSPRRLYAVLAPLGVLLMLWLWLFYAEGAVRGGPSGKAFGADYAMFSGAAQVLQQRGDPYDPRVLYATEQSFLAQRHLAMTPYRPVVRVGNPPLFFWALQSLNRLPFQVAAFGWIAAMYVLSGLGFLALLRHLGWRSRIVPLIFFLAMPQVVLGAFYGNVIGLVFAAMALAIPVASRSPVAAGVLLSLAWLKPPVALPLVMLIVLFHSRSRLKLIGGFAAATAGWLLLTVITTGWSSLQLWVEGLTRYSRDMAIQPDVASLAGLYVRWAPLEPRIIIEVLILAGAAALTVRYWLQRRGTIDSPLIAAGWLWFVWMLATPYAHFFDEILLAAPLLAFFGVDGRYVAFRSRAVTLYLLFFSLLLISWMPLQANLLSIPLAIVALFVVAASKPSKAATRGVSYDN